MNVLEEIAEARKARVRELEVEDPVGEPADAMRPFRFLEAVRRSEGERAHLIAEVKRGSPSAGVLAANLDGAAAVRAFEKGGAAALSVVTEEERFGGSIALFRQARGAAERPVLWKDFVVSDYQLRLARRERADAVLVIAALARASLAETVERALALGVEPLVEVHDEEEARRAVDSPARLVGINNRDLSTLRIDLATTERIAPLVAGRVVVAESGVESAGDFRRLEACGVDAVLVGTSLMRASNLEAGARRLIEGSAS